ncbi:molecular chaperone Tir [Patescibacteria group bacterium]|nr:MAG: molecular chaperone Tir [Patescibacteria group bacterium]
MARKCFISFKTEDIAYKEAIQNDPNIDMIDKSLNEAIDSDDEDYIMRAIRDQYLSDSTVTIHLIGNKSSEVLGYEEQKFIKRELQASLYNGENNARSGILGVVLPSMYESIFKGPFECTTCRESHNWVIVGDGTTVSEFHRNYYIQHDKCHHAEDDRYCVLVKWDDFRLNPNTYIEQAFLKRDHAIAEKVKVRP